MKTPARRTAKQSPFRTALLAIGVMVVLFTAGGIVILLTVNAIAMTLGFTPGAARGAVIIGLWLLWFVSAFAAALLVRNI